MTMIIPLILNKIKTGLTTALITNIATTDPSRASVVKIGRFQQDPTIQNIYLAISPGNPEDPEYKDGVVSMREWENIGFEIPAREVGGGAYWWRRGIVQIGCYYVVDRVPEEIALAQATMVLGRTEKALEEISMSGVVDEFGEIAYGCPFVYANTFFESGGPPADYIWRGKIYWSVLTSRNSLY